MPAQAPIGASDAEAADGSGSEAYTEAGGAPSPASVEGGGGQQEWSSDGGSDMVDGSHSDVSWEGELSDAEQAPVADGGAWDIEL